MSSDLETTALHPKTRSPNIPSIEEAGGGNGNPNRNNHYDNNTGSTKNKTSNQMNLFINHNNTSYYSYQTISSSNGSPGSAGTIMSFVIMILGIITSIFLYQFGDSEEINSFLFDNHTDHHLCTDDLYEASCRANSIVLRISFALSILFTLQIIGTLIVTSFYDRFWVLKTFFFMILVIVFFVIKVDIFSTNGYAWFARITGFFFVILEQIILIDLAYTWNEKWIEYSQDVEIDPSDSGIWRIGGGNVWLTGIIVFSLFFYIVWYIGIGIMFWQFNNHCQDTMTILSLTIILPFIATVLQLFYAERGSILTSAIMTLYSVYVAYSAISLHPNDHCNPTLDSKYQTITSIIGIILTAISLIWTTYSAVKKIPQVTDKSTGNTIDLTDLATGGEETSEMSSSLLSSSTAPTTAFPSKLLKRLFIQVSVVFLCVSGYYAMVLTNWSTEQTSTSVSNPRTGTAAMWIQATGSWIAIAFYLWTLIAPKILSERDFS